VALFVTHSCGIWSFPELQGGFPASQWLGGQATPVPYWFRLPDGWLGFSAIDYAAVQSSGDAER